MLHRHGPSVANHYQPDRSQPCTRVSGKREALDRTCRRYMSGGWRSSVPLDPKRSDADLLIEFEPDTDSSSAQFLDLKEALEQVLERPVDLVERVAVEQSRNYLRRRRILQEAEPLFVAG